MKTLKHNGENWYIDTRSAFKRARQWLCWIGGWEKANGAGWTIPRAAIKLDGYLESLTPVSLLGHRVTFQWFGVDIRIRGRGILCWHWKQRRFERAGKGYAYFSRNGTPSEATRWFWGWQQYFGTSDIKRIEHPR